MQLCNHAERLIAIEKSVYYLIGLNNVFVSVRNFSIIEMYCTIILYSAEGLRCRTTRFLDRIQVSGGGLTGLVDYENN